MIPYRDDNPTQIWPLVTLALVAANIAVYVWCLLQPSYPAVICHWGAFASDLTGSLPQKLPAAFRCTVPRAPAELTLVTHMFFHGGLLHLAGNMIYLWIFGNNIEDALGHVRFVLFYLICGFAALLAQVLANPHASVPLVGASGAIAGVLGAYLVLFPLARVSVLIPIFIFFTTIRVPAFLMLFFWFGMQLLSGVADSVAGSQGGVAWYAHIGGFVAGVILIVLFPKRVSRR